MGNPLFDLSETELRDLCRHQIDSFEHWSRRLIHDTFTDSYGEDYLNFCFDDGQPLVKNEIKNRIENRVSRNKTTYARKIDAILLDDIGYFLCREFLYNNHFKEVLEPFYSGKKEIESILNRLVIIRNKLSHENIISIHEAEQCICYTDDMIELYKLYYEAKGKEKDYNVPMFLQFKDSLGNVAVRKDYDERWKLHFNGLYGDGEPIIKLRSGECYKLWAEVDSSFDSSFYEVRWRIRQLVDVIREGEGNVVEFIPDDKNVSYSPEIIFSLITKRGWHRFQAVDDMLVVSLGDVRPPIEDTY